MKINLLDYTNRDEMVLSGRNVGEDLRKKLKITEVDNNNNIIVKIIIPDEIFSMNSSYFLGLFGPSVRSLGEVNFRKKYLFECDDIIRKNIEEGIDLALKESDPLKV